MLAGTRSPLVHGPQRNAQGRLVPADGYGKVKGERNKEKGQRAKAKGERRTKSCLEEEKVVIQRPAPSTQHLNKTTLNGKCFTSKDGKWRSLSEPVEVKPWRAIFA